MIGNSKRKIFIVFYLLSMTIGCDHPESEKVFRETIWLDNNLDDGLLSYCKIERGDEIRYIWHNTTYMAWPDGRSIAISIPIDNGAKLKLDGRCSVFNADKHIPSIKNYKKSFPPKRVFFSIEDLSVYYNTKKLCELPFADNTLYIFGKDLKLHDSGFSAEWALGPGRALGTLSIDVPTKYDPVTEAPIAWTKREISWKEIKNYPDKRISASSWDYEEDSRYAQQRGKFSQMVEKLAFGEDTVYLDPWGKLEKRPDNTWEVNYPRKTDAEQRSRWRLRGVYALRNGRPEDWKSAYPKDDHNWSPEDLGLEKNKPEAVHPLLQQENEGNSQEN